MSQGSAGRVDGIARGDAPRPALLQRKCACGGSRAAGAGECEQCRRGKPLQAKLAVGPDNDPLEREADRVADQIIGAGAPGGAGPAVSAIEGTDAGPGAREAPDSVQQTLSGAGSALEAPVRRDMERRFGHDFSRVRVHTDATAGRSAHEVNAAAYTVGNDVAFAQGQYAPATPAGRRLLAHELAHVVQQEGGRSIPRVMRDKPKPEPKPGKTIDFGKEEEAPKPAPARKPGTTGAVDDATLLFQDAKIAGDPAQPDRNRVFVEPQLTTIGKVNIRFAYPASEMSSGSPSSQVTQAKKQVGGLIAEVIADLGTFQYSSAKEETEIGTQRTRLGQAFRQGSAAKPINIYIATLPSSTELTSDKYIPYTDRVYINAKDVGDRTKLEAAIRLPLQNLVGGFSPVQRKDVPAASKDDLKKTMLHEALHAMLTAQNAGSDAHWDALKGSGKFAVTGPQAAQAKAEELLRKFLIAQEERFAYTSVGSLYPPVDAIDASFASFIKQVELFIKKRGGTVRVVKQNIAVTEKFKKKPVSWTVEFRLPPSMSVTDKDVATIDLLLLAYPNNVF